MVVKVKFKNGSFKPVKKIRNMFKENEIVEIEIKKKKNFSWRGALKGRKETSVELQHKIKDMW